MGIRMNVQWTMTITFGTIFCFLAVITERAPEKWRQTAEKSDEVLKRTLLQKAERVEEMLKTLQNRDSFLQALEKVDQVLNEVENQLKLNKGSKS